MLTILLVDDHALFREGLASLFGHYDDLQVIGQAGTAEDALAAARDLRPDVVLMDINLPGSDGIELTKRLKHELPRTAVVMLTIHEDGGKLLDAVRAGASGYLVKNIGAAELVTQLRRLSAGEAPLTGALAARLLTELRSPDEQAAVGESLTYREQEVLALIAQRLSNRDIAERLVISEHTVKNHVKSILAKLQARNRRQAGVVAAARGWLPQQ